MKLKSILLACLATFALKANAQNAFNVLNGFTLEGTDSVFVSTPSEKGFITQNGSYFVVEDVTGEVEVTVTAKGMKSRTTVLNIRKTKYTGAIILEPLDSVLQAYHNQYPIYAKDQKEQSWVDSLKYRIKSPDTQLLDAVDKMAEFPGGLEAMKKFLVDNLKYPEAAIDHTINGKVYLQFVVSMQGNISNVSVVRSANLPMDLEAVRVVQLMPQWTPGEVEGKPVNSTFNLPISFRLM